MENGKGNCSVGGSAAIAAGAQQSPKQVSSQHKSQAAGTVSPPFSTAFDALYRDRLEALSALIDSNPHLLEERELKYFNTLLHFASDQGNEEAVMILLDKGADIRSVNHDGNTAFMLACLFGHLQVCILLLGRDPQLHLVKNNSGMTAALLAAQMGQHTVLRHLVNVCGVDIHEKLPSNGVTALIIAAHRGSMKCVEFLLDKGADVNTQATTGFSSLYMACQEAHIDIIRLLLARGAKPNISDHKGAVPLMIAAQEGHSYVCRMLLERGADPNLKKNDSFTSLLVAAQAEHTITVSTLLEFGANPNTSNAYGATPLMLAAASGQHKTLVILLRGGASQTINALANDSSTALSRACYMSHVDCVRELLAAGADPNIGRSALLEATSELPRREDETEAEIELAWSYRLDIVKELLFFRANTTVTNANCLNPLGIAQKNAQTQMVLLLETHQTIDKRCGKCGASKAPLQCSRCKKEAYCDHSCFKQHWKIHKLSCSSLGASLG